MTYIKADKLILRFVSEVEDLIMVVVETCVVDVVNNVVFGTTVEVRLGLMGMMVDTKGVVMTVVETSVVSWLFKEEGIIVVSPGAVVVS